MTKKKFSFKEAAAAIVKLLDINLADIPAAGDVTAADSLKSYTTDASSTVKIDKLETGGKVYDVDGTTPITTGFTLSDGTVVAVDTTGTITTVTVPVPAGADATGTDTPDMMAMRDLVGKFATGTPEERIANLEAMVKALMQYCFGWKLDEAARKAMEDAAITAYQTLGVSGQFTEQIRTEKEARAKFEATTRQGFAQVLGLVQAIAEAPAEEPVQKPEGKVAGEGKKERAIALLAAAREHEDNED